MDDFALARAIHVIAVLFWIGGVGFVTWVVMPAIRANEAPADRLSRFQQIEGRFAWQARIWVLLAGLTGLWLIHRADMWTRFAEPYFWWMHMMVALWAVFALMLFVLEPLVLHRRMALSNTPEADVAHMMRLHQLLSILGVVTVFAAVGGSHGIF
ncbi:MAG: hypothetical protein IPK89_14490 [Sphingomonadales bacterium]|nr:hypothetical protein [Sphingomonadales bacterium]